jgi:hypothetical protein
MDDAHLPTERLSSPEARRLLLALGFPAFSSQSLSFVLGRE